MTLDEYPADVRAEVAHLRQVVCDLHAELPRWGLVVWTAGNVSQRLATADLFVIKPSGVSYDELTPESMVVCDLDGTLVDGTRSPSSDTAAHAYVYRHMPHVNGVVHTHSTYATAWAARGEPIPCVLTMMGDEFGGEIPVGPFALIGDDSIGRGIVETLRGSRSPADGPPGDGGGPAVAVCGRAPRGADPDPAAPRRRPARALPERLRPALSRPGDSPTKEKA